MYCTCLNYARAERQVQPQKAPSADGSQTAGASSSEDQHGSGNEIPETPRLQEVKIPDSTQDESAVVPEDEEDDLPMAPMYEGLLFQQLLRRVEAFIHNDYAVNLALTSVLSALVLASGQSALLRSYLVDPSLPLPTEGVASLCKSLSVVCTNALAMSKEIEEFEWKVAKIQSELRLPMFCLLELRL